MNHEYEPEIDMRDLFFYILYKWRSILVAALVFCALACGYKTACNIAEVSAEGSGGMTKATREYEMELASYELTKSSYERNMADYQKRLEQQEAYMRESILMRADPYNVPNASADFFIKLDKSEWEGLPTNTSFDPTDSLLSAYTSNFYSVIDWTPIEKLAEKDALYLKELVSVSADYNGNTFTVLVRHSEGNIAQQILDIIVGQITDRYQSMDMDISKHSISVVNRALAYTIDSSLADTQKWNADVVTSYEQAIIDCQVSLESLEKPYPSSGLTIYFVLGFAVGMFLAIAFYGGAYICGGRIQEKDALKDRYSYRLLGVMPHVGNHRFLPFIDQHIEKIEGICKHFSTDAACRAVAAGVRNLTGGCGKLLVTGSVDFGKLQGFSEQLAPLLEGVSVTVAENICLVPDTFRDLVQCDAVLLVEERHMSRLEDIQQEQEFITTLNKNVIGYVLL